MELAELRVAFEEARKVFSAVTDAAVWADLFHKTATGQVVPNAQHLPGYVKNRQHVAQFNRVVHEVGKVDSNARTALLVHWIPSLHSIQNDDLIVSIAAAADVSMDAARDTMLHIAGMPDPNPTAGGTRDEIIARINSARTAEADSLNLVRLKPEMYAQFYIDQIKGGFWQSGAKFVAFLQANWPAVKAVLIDRVKTINDAINTPATGLVAKTNSWADRMKAWADAAKK